MKCLTLLLLLVLVAGCQESNIKRLSSYPEYVWTAEHLRLFMAMGIDKQLKNHPYENIRDE